MLLEMSKIIRTCYTPTHLHCPTARSTCPQGPFSKEIKSATFSSSPDKSPKPDALMPIVPLIMGSCVRSPKQSFFKFSITAF